MIILEYLLLYKQYTQNNQMQSFSIWTRGQETQNLPQLLILGQSVSYNNECILQWDWRCLEWHVNGICTVAAEIPGYHCYQDKWTVFSVCVLWWDIATKK